jgi:hypothetical protein
MAKDIAQFIVKRRTTLFLFIVALFVAKSLHAQSPIPQTAAQLQEEREIQAVNRLLPESLGIFLTLSGSVFTNGLREEFPQSSVFGFVGIPPNVPLLSGTLSYWRIILGTSFYNNLILAEPQNLRLQPSFGSNIMFGVSVYEANDANNHSLRIFPEVGMGWYRIKPDLAVYDVRVNFQCGVGALYSVALFNRNFDGRIVSFSIPIRIDIGYERHYASLPDRLQDKSGLGGVFARLSVGIGGNASKAY